ncbi:MAG: hypothetical protein KKB25_02225 [Nanoarchaeota archaeon]|nr:hypothetical protein [Nanoarchaeota archaeon]
MLEETEFRLEKLKNQYPEIFEKIPAELLELAFSEETSSKIEEICTKNGIENEESIEKVAYYVGLVLFGGLHPANLQSTLEKELNLSFFKAEKIVQEINQSIFSLIIAEKLEELYERGNVPFEVKEVLETEPSPSEAMPGLEEKPEIKEEKPTRPPGRDIYKEPTE